MYPADPRTPTQMPLGLRCTVCERPWGGWPGWAKVEVRHKKLESDEFPPSPKGNEICAVLVSWT